jgi:uncharacterized protein YbjT (DUF2867 family)
MAETILVTGGTGTLGRLVAERLRDTGSDVRVLSRGRRRDRATDVVHVTADLDTGEGVVTAVSGARIIVHLAGSARGDEDKTRHLIGAAVRADVSHLIYISVVGADRIRVTSRMDRMMFGYFASKCAAERLVAESGLPWSTLRATQFHDLVLKTVAGLARLPVIPVPRGIRFQPIDAGEVADRLVDLTLGAPAGLVPDLGGPQAFELAELVRSYLRIAGKHRLIMPMPLMGKAAEALRAGANLTPERAVGLRTWEDFLTSRLSMARGHPVAST